jgi:hypothetical protein
MPVPRLVGIDAPSLRLRMCASRNRAESPLRRSTEMIIAHRGLTGDDAKTALRKLKDKVTLAEFVVREWDDTATVPPYVDELIGLIQRSRVA